MAVRTFSLGYFVQQCLAYAQEALGYSTAAAASAGAALASAGAAAESEGIATEAAAEIVNVKLDYWPGTHGGTPTKVLLDANLGVVWDAIEEQGRTDELFTLGNVKYKLDYWPGRASGENWKLYADGGIFSEPAAASGANASNLSSARNDTSKAGVPRELTNRVMFIGVKGQSLSIQGGTYTPTLINTTALYPSNVLIPSAGTWPNGQSWSSPKGAVDEYYKSNVSQGSNPTGATQSLSVSLGLRLYSLINADTSIAPITLTVVNGAGGTSIQDLGPGTTVSEAELRDMQSGRDWAVSQGYDIYMPFLVWIHGNEDFLTMSGPQYKAWLLTEQKWHTEAARRIFGQTEEVLYYIEQCTSARTSVGDVSEVIQAQLELTLEHPTKFRFLSPAYDLKHPDGVHMDSPNYHIRDLRHAETIYKDLFCGGQRPFCVTAAWWTSTTTIRCRIETRNAPIAIDYSNNSHTVTFDATADTVGWTAHGLANGTLLYVSNSGGALPPELAAGTRYYVVNTATDTFQVASTSGGSAINFSTAGTGTHTAIVGGDGIQFDDGSVSPPYVTGISIVDTGEASGSGNDPYGRALVDVTLSGAPAAVGRNRLLIGQLSAPSAGQGAMGGARTTIRDSASGTSAVDRDGAANTYTLRNWLARQEIVLP